MFSLIVYKPSFVSALTSFLIVIIISPVIFFFNLRNYKISFLNPVFLFSNLKFLVFSPEILVSNPEI